MAQKYIIGDLVRYTSLYKEPIAEICEIRETSYLIRYMNGNFAKVTNEEIKPIPLTPEILEKNGWKKEMYHDWRHYMTIEGNILHLSKGVGIDGAFPVCVGKDMSYIASISFVHQLQHLLFGLGINSEMEV